MATKIGYFKDKNGDKVTESERSWMFAVVKDDTTITAATNYTSCLIPVVESQKSGTGFSVSNGEIVANRTMTVKVSCYLAYYKVDKMQLGLQIYSDWTRAGHWLDNYSNGAMGLVLPPFVFVLEKGKKVSMRNYFNTAGHQLMVYSNSYMLVEEM